MSAHTSISAAEAADLAELHTDHGVTIDARYLENEIGVLMPERE